MDLSFALKVFRVTIPSVNAATKKLAPQHSMDQLGSTLPHIIEAVGPVLFVKLDIKDGYWQMVVPKGAE